MWTGPAKVKNNSIVREQISGLKMATMSCAEAQHTAASASLNENTLQTSLLPEAPLEMGSCIATMRALNIFDGIMQ
jgi:hypothetical protein